MIHHKRVRTDAELAVSEVSLRRIDAVNRNPLMAASYLWDWAAVHHWNTIPTELDHRGIAVVSYNYFYRGLDRIQEPIAPFAPVGVVRIGKLANRDERIREPVSLDAAHEPIETLALNPRHALADRLEVTHGQRRAVRKAGRRIPHA